MTSLRSTASAEEKLAVLEAALNDAQDNLRFAESKAGFIAVVMAATVALLPAIPSLKNYVGLEAIKNTFKSYFVGESKSPIFDLAFLMMAQIAVILAISLMLLSILFAIRALIPIHNARKHLDLQYNPQEEACESNLFYPTGFSRKQSLWEVLLEPKNDLKFSFTARQQRLIIGTVTTNGLINTMGEQVIVLGFIRDLKMTRVSYALKMILNAVVLIFCAVFLITIRYFIFGGK